jgi:hypothetical protein
MRLHHRATQQYVGGTWTYPVPTATVTTRLPGGATVQAGLAAGYNGTYHRLYFDTTNMLYTSGMLYQADWTITIGGTAYTTTDYYAHCTPTTSDVTGPGAPAIGVETTDSDSVTFSHTPPDDADYATTVIYGWPVYGGTVVTGTGTGASIEVAGLSPATPYIFVPVAYDTDGNPSTPGRAVQETTLAGDLPDFPLWVKFFVNDETEPIVTEAVDAMRGGSHPLYHLGVGRTARVRLECHAPVPSLQIRGIGGIYQTRDLLPGGLRDGRGS